MLIADVNLLVHAHRHDDPRHEAHRDWLATALQAPEPFGVSELVLASFMRMVTNRRVFPEPTPPDRALAFAEAVLASPSAVRVRTGERHWAIFADLCRQVGARGNLVPDAHLAAQAIEQGARLVTHDRGFARFPGLRWSLPEI